MPGCCRAACSLAAQGGQGSIALVLALLAEATWEGSWSAITGMPVIGVAAAAELGVDLDRLGLIPDSAVKIAAVLLVLIDGVDLVVRRLAVAHGMRSQLAGRGRNPGAVLVVTGQWPGADLELRVANRRWRSLIDDGSGHLEFHDVVTTSRGSPAHRRATTFGLRRCCRRRRDSVLPRGP